MLLRLFLAALLPLTFSFSFGQSQTGKLRVHVIDAETNEPLPYANVYFDQTTIGSYTNDQGDAEINKIPFGTYRLIVSEIAHVAYQKNITVQSEEVTSMTVKLLVKVLDEVKVVGKRDTKWERQLERFEKLFFGAEHYKYCKITNAGVLDFKITEGNIIAEASEPLKIENDYLGYNIDFTIRNCFFNATSFAITGTTRFEEKTGDEASVAKWKENRESSYRGSPTHFFKAAIAGTLKSEGYALYRDISKKEKITRGSTLSSNINFTIVPDSLTGKVKRNPDGTYSITLPPRLEVHYLRKRAPVSAYTDLGVPISWLEVRKGLLVVNRDGLLQNPDNVTLAGYMTEMRVGDWLPINYVPSTTHSNVVAGPKVVTKDLRERPYVQTDRNYYYKGETIWLKGYMNYPAPILKDTLSRTVYVQVVHRDGYILAEKKYPINDGKFQGDILVNKRFKPGLYQLKAYTSWMLNFGSRLIFTRTIEILDQKETVSISPGYEAPTDTLPNISLLTNKHSYSPGEKITLTIDVTDNSGFRTTSDLSIAVTDLDQAVPSKYEKTIVASYPFADKYMGDSTINVKSDIEYGIDFKGKLMSGDKPVQGTITVFQSASAETFDIATDKAGRFKKNLLFSDTLDLYLKAVTQKNKKAVVVMDTIRPTPPAIPFEELSYHKESSDLNKRVAGLNFNDATVLKGISVTAKKIETVQSSNLAYNAPDYTIDGDWIMETNYIDIFQAIMAKVPGMQYNPSVPSIRFIAASYGSFGDGGGGGGPLIMVDGVPVSESTVISTVPVKSVSRIDVLKFGSAASYGARGSNGVIAIYTRTGIPKAFEKQITDKKKLQAVRWSGYNTTSTFIAREYPATVFWSPTVTTDGKEPATVSFNAADVPTKYRIVVEGVTASGTPVRAEEIVEVVKGH